MFDTETEKKKVLTVEESEALAKEIDDLFSEDDESIESILENSSIKEFFKRASSEGFLHSVLQDERLKEIIATRIVNEANPKYWEYFRDILSDENNLDILLEIFKDENLKKFSSDDSGLEIFFASLTECDANKTVLYALNNEKFMSEYRKKASKFFSLLDSLDNVVIKEVIEKDLEFATNVIPLSKENYDYLIKDSSLDFDKVKEIISRCRNMDVLSDFFTNDTRRMEVFNGLNKHIIALMVDNNVHFAEDILSSQKLFESIKCENIVTFRNRINRLEEANASVDIEEKLRGYYEKLLASYNPETGLFAVYEDILRDIHEHGYINPRKYEGLELICDLEEIHECITVEDFQRLSTKKLKEIVNDFLFKDNRYNVSLNLREVLRFGNNNPEENIERIKQIEKIITTIEKGENAEIIQLFNDTKESRIGELYYDMMRNAKSKAREDLKDSLFDEESMEPQEYNGTKVYDLREKDYYILVRALNHPYTPVTSNERDCYSLISSENTRVSGNGQTRFLYGYNDFDQEMIIHMLEKDAFSSNTTKDPTKFVDRVMTPRELVTNNMDFSEIEIQNEKDENGRPRAMRPNFIVAIDTISEDILEESRRLNIPIVLINEKKLDHNAAYNPNDDEISYVTSHFEEKRRNR